MQNRSSNLQERYATFLKLAFFWGGVLVSEIWAKCISLGGHDPGLLTLVHEKSGNLSCVSFGEECISLFFIMLHVVNNYISHANHSSFSNVYSMKQYESVSTH